MHTNHVVERRRQNLGVKIRTLFMVGCVKRPIDNEVIETKPPFTVPCEGREAWFLHRPHQESNPWLLRDSSLHNRCATPAPRTVYPCMACTLRATRRTVQ